MKMFRKSKKTRQRENRLTWVQGLQSRLGTLDEVSHSAHCRAISTRQYFVNSIAGWVKDGVKLGAEKTKQLGIVRSYIKTLDAVVALPFVKLLTRRQRNAAHHKEVREAKWARQAVYEAERDAALAAA